MCIRDRNVTVGYTLPKEWTRKAYIEKARIYFSGSNLFLLHKGNDLPVDPEISTGNGLTAGGWGRIAPITRTFSFGVQVTCLLYTSIIVFNPIKVPAISIGLKTIMPTLIS